MTFYDDIGPVRLSLIEDTETGALIDIGIGEWSFDNVCNIDFGLPLELCEGEPGSLLDQWDQHGEGFAQFMRHLYESRTGRRIEDRKRGPSPSIKMTSPRRARAARRPFKQLLRIINKAYSDAAEEGKPPPWIES